MAKSDSPLDEIDTSNCQSDKRETQWLEGKGITAMDFETTDGDPFMLAVSEATGESYFYAEDRKGTPIEWETIIETMAKRKYSGDQIVVWFNLSFDAEVFASMLPYEKAERLYVENQVSLDVNGREIDMKYIPGKKLKFTLAGGQTIEHYDIANLVRGSLDETSKEWLDDVDGKKETVDTSRFGDTDYIERNFIDIAHYAKHDAEITKRLARKVISKAETMGIPCRKPVSTGSVSQQWMSHNLEEKPNWGSTKMQTLAWESYHAGRFEVFERGDVGEVAGPDINSAYPAVMSNLPDPGSLEWKITSDVDVADLRRADYGFARITVSTDPDRRIQPFAKKIDGTVKYPAFDGGETTALNEIIIHAIDNDIITDIEIHEAALGFECEYTSFPFSFFDDVYDERKSLEAEGRTLAGQMLKIVLNSAYGKTVQTNLQATIPEEAIKLSELDDCEQFKEMNDIPFIERQKAGSWFNPFIGTYITGMTRLKLHKAVLDHGLEDDTIMFATDCLMIRKEPFEQSDFRSVKCGDTLGEWDFDYDGEAFVIGSGVYEVDTGDYLKMSTRGFREAQFESMRKAAKDHGVLEIEQARPQTLGEAIAQDSKMDLMDVGAWETFDRTLQPDFDSKRDWPTDSITWNDMISGSEYGDPLIYSG